MPTRLPLQNTRAIQVVVNAFLLAPGNFIVEQLSLRDVGIIWAYDFVWLVVLDLVKMGILNVQEGGVAPLEETQGRGGFGSLGGGVKRTANARAALSKLAKDVSRLAMGIGSIKMREKGRPVLQKGLKINPHTGMPIPGGGRPLMGPGWN
jgi:hypothetical protein